MWHSMFAVQIPIAEKVLRTVLVYATILILFRLTGKRDLATLNMFDFVVLFLLSNVVQNAASCPARRVGWHCGLPTWNKPSGYRTATISRRWRPV